ncbi:MAG: inner membrane CreD family protein [Opitutaceae bacterium]
MESPFSTPPVRVPRRQSATLKGLIIAALILVLQIPLLLVSNLRVERVRNHRQAVAAMTEERREALPVVQGYRMVERSLKYGVLVMALVFAAFFLFETLSDLRLHAVHYGLVGAALCLFYMALLALAEVLPPGWAYSGAAVASSLMVVLYSASILRSYLRAAVVGALLAVVHAVLFVVLRMESYALLAGTATLFVALGAVMYLTRNVDWSLQDGTGPRTSDTAVES